MTNRLINKLATMSAVERTEMLRLAAEAEQHMQAKQAKIDAAKRLAEAAKARLTAEHDKAAKALDAQFVSDLSDAIAAINRDAGLTGDDMVTAGVRGTRVAARYRHPTDASKVWTGRGRSPLWVDDIGGLHNAIDLTKSTGVDAT
jgi:DNA-binding protein H-NS